MNQRENLILHNGQDITADVRFCQYNPTYKKYGITFQSGKIYQYNYNSIEWIRKPELIDPTLVHITHGDRELFNIENIFIFRGAATDYWHVCFSNGSERTYDKRELKIATSCLNEKKSQDCLDYLRELTSINELKSDDGEVLLQKQYDSLDAFFTASSSIAAFSASTIQAVSASTATAIALMLPITVTQALFSGALLIAQLSRSQQFT